MDHEAILLYTYMQHFIIIIYIDIPDGHNLTDKAHCELPYTVQLDLNLTLTRVQ